MSEVEEISENTEEKSFFKKITDLMDDLGVTTEFVDDVPEEGDNWDLFILIPDVFDAIKLVRELSGIAWIQVHEDYEGWYMYLKEGACVESPTIH